MTINLLSLCRKLMYTGSSAVRIIVGESHREWSDWTHNEFMTVNIFFWRSPYLCMYVDYIYLKIFTHSLNIQLTTSAFSSARKVWNSPPTWWRKDNRYCNCTTFLIPDIKPTYISVHPIPFCKNNLSILSSHLIVLLSLPFLKTLKRSLKIYFINTVFPFLKNSLKALS